MASIKSIFLTSGLVALASAYTQPGANTYGSLLTPDLTHPVTQGQAFQVTWQQPQGAPAGQTVSLVLCNGPSTNCVTQKSAIVEGVQASANAYTWNVPCDLPVGVQNTDTGYGMLIIVDGTGEFQYSTQFSVNAGSGCTGGNGGSTTTTTTSSSSSSSNSTTTSSGWGSWNTTTPVTPTTTSYFTTYTTPAQVTTSAYYTTPASSAPVAPTSTFTGAAVQTAVNVAGALGAAALAMLAL